MIEDTSKGPVYDKSPLPPAKPGGLAGERNPDRAISLDDRGKMNYASAAAEGRVEIEIPALPGDANPTERLHAVDFGPHVAGKIESSMKRNPYLKSGPQQNPGEVLKHYVAVARGASLLDAGALKRMGELAEEFSTEQEQEEFFKQVVRPYLLSLRPERRDRD